jgi:Rieske Fe-S protein
MDRRNRPPCTSCLERSLNRRGLLSLAGTSAGLAILASTLPGCGNPTGAPISGPVSGGNVSALAVGTLLVMSNFAVARDAGGVYAMSAVCTHAGCLLDDGASTIASGLGCPCHGSVFDGNGAVIAGPARDPLAHYLVTIADDGSITVDGSQPVSASARVPVA